MSEKRNWRQGLGSVAVSLVFLSLGVLVAQAPAFRCSPAMINLIEKTLNLSYFQCRVEAPFKMHGRNTDTRGRQAVPCPTDAHLVLVTGQSNSANFLMADDYQHSNVYNAFDGQCYALQDPVLGATNHAKSLMPAIASKLDVDKPLVFLTTGWSSTSILDWANPDFELASYTNQELKRLQDQGLTLEAMVWIQGEQDAHTTTDYEAEFSKAMDLVFNGIAARDTATLIVTQSTICGRRTPDTHLQAAQAAVHLGAQPAIVAINTDTLGHDFRHDTCHYNAAGVEKIATAIAKPLQDVLTTGPTAQ